MINKRINDWQIEYVRNLRKLEQNEELNHKLPEAALFLHQIKRFRGLTEADLRQQADPPRLLLEIIPSLDLYTYEERHDGTNWHVLVPVILTNSGGLPAISTNVWIKSQNGSTPTFKSETETGPLTIEAGDFARVVFKLECVDSVEIEVGGRYRSPKYYHQEQDDEYIPFQSLPLTFGALPISDLTSSFTPDKPLEGALWDKYKSKDVQSSVEKLLNELNVEVTGRFYEVYGLRQTGKTTILDRVLEKSKEICWNGSKRKYISAKVDLHQWLTTPPTQGNQQKVPSDQLFWTAILHEVSISETLPQGTLKTELKGILKEGIQSGGLELCREWLKKIGKQEDAFILLAIDDGDFFSAGIAPIEPGVDPISQTWSGIATGLRTLVEREKIVILLAHGHEESLWEKSFSNTPYRQSTFNSPARYKTGFFTHEEVLAVLDNTPLTFTHLAKEAFWLYTGGYPVLVQILGRSLTQRISERGINKNARSRLVSSEDVKRAVSDVIGSLHWGRYIDYLRDGFRNEEQRLMVTLATSRYLGSGTNLFIPEKLSKRREAWHGLDRLQEQFNKDHPSPDVDKELLSVEHLLICLVDKQILEVEETTGLIRWRVGLLHSWALYMAPKVLGLKHE